MAIKTKAQLAADIAALPAPITRTTLLTVLDDMVDSYEDIIQEYTTAARNALTPVQGQKIFNTTNKRLEIYSGTAWLPCSQKDAVILDASSNPNYPQGGVGDLYTITVAGKVGGAGGKSAYVGDLVYCISENAGGVEASVGTSWKVCHSQGATDNQTFLAELSLSAAQILALNATPLTLVAAGGAGTVVVPVSPIIASMDYGTTPYATNTSMRALFDDANDVEIFDLTTANDALKMTQFELNEHDIFDNIPLRVSVNTGNPTAGDSTMKIRVYYKYLTL